MELYKSNLVDKDEEVSAEGQPLNTLIKSLKNEDVKTPIMHFLKKMMVNKRDLSSVIKQYIKNIPDKDNHMFIGPLIVFQILKDSYIQKVNKKQSYFSIFKICFLNFFFYRLTKNWFKFLSQMILNKYEMLSV